MDDRIRMTRYTGKSAVDFLGGHPSEIEGHVAAAQELHQTVSRMDEVFAMFETGRREEAAAIQEKVRLLDVVQDDFLLPIAAISRGNADLDPATARRFRAPARASDKAAYLGTARSIRALAEVHKAVFVGDGMQDGFTVELDATLAAYDAAVTAANINRQLHVQARAELGALATRVMKLLKRLDGINRVRFRKEPHLLEAWKAARNVAWPVVTPAEKVEKPVV
jgi:hypothetical protein